MSIRSTLAAAALLLAPLAANAQTAPAKAAPVTITFYNYNLGSAGLGAEATKKMIAEFMQAKPNITVRGVGPTSAEFMTRVQADIVAGQQVDLVQMIFADLDFAVRSLGARALEDIVPKEEISAHFAGMVPNGVKLGVLDGKTYGLAYTFSTPVLFYNADIFRKAGLDPERPPKTWAEVKQAALAIQEKTGKQGLATGIFGPSAFDWLFQGVIRSNGGSTINADRTRMTFAEPAAVEAVKMLRDLADAGVLRNQDTNTSMDNMAAGNVGMFLQTSAVQAVLVRGAEGKFELRASTMPSFGEKPVRPNNSGSALTILTADPARQRAAWELMKFLTSKRGYTIITSEIGYLPLRTDIVNDPQYLGDWVKKHPLIQPNLDQLAVLEPWTPMPGPNYRQIVKTMMNAVEVATFSKTDVEATLKEAQDQTQRLIPRR